MVIDNLLTLREVADLLRVSPQTVYKMIRDRQIEALKVGSQWRFEASRVHAWLSSRRGIERSVS